MIFSKVIEKIYKQNIYVRCDDTGLVFYYSAEDFPGLKKEEYVFDSSKGHKLYGNFFYYDNYKPCHIVVFDHGHGGGHRSYMKEIELLAKEGYLVFAYDHTGCMLSGGESSNGLTQSLVDLNDCMNALRSEERFRDYTYSVVGHSWGAFSTLNILALHPYIKHVIPICGFVSVWDMVKQNFSGMLKFWRKDIFALEKRTNPGFVDYNAVETLKNTDAHVLLIYSDNDPMVKKEMHYDVLYDALKNKANVEFLLEKGKAHNPNYTVDAVTYKDEFVSELSKYNNKERSELEKAEFKARFDWERMTKQDEKVWSKIFETLKK